MELKRHHSLSFRTRTSPTQSSKQHRRSWPFRTRKEEREQQLETHDPHSLSLLLQESRPRNSVVLVTTEIEMVVEIEGKRVESGKWRGGGCEGGGDVGVWLP